MVFMDLGPRKCPERRQTEEGVFKVMDHEGTGDCACKGRTWILGETKLLRLVSYLGVPRLSQFIVF